MGCVSRGKLGNRAFWKQHEKCVHSGRIRGHRKVSQRRGGTLPQWNWTESVIPCGGTQIGKDAGVLWPGKRQGPGRMQCEHSSTEAREGLTNRKQAFVGTSLLFIKPTGLLQAAGKPTFAGTGLAPGKRLECPLLLTSSMDTVRQGKCLFVSLTFRALAFWAVFNARDRFSEVSSR